MWKAITCYCHNVLAKRDCTFSARFPAALSSPSLRPSLPLLLPPPTLPLCIPSLLLLDIFLPTRKAAHLSPFPLPVNASVCSVLRSAGLPAQIIPPYLQPLLSFPASGARWQPAPQKSGAVVLMRVFLGLRLPRGQGSKALLLGSYPVCDRISGVRSLCSSFEPGLCRADRKGIWTEAPWQGGEERRGVQRLSAASQSCMVPGSFQGSSTSGFSSMSCQLRLVFRLKKNSYLGFWNQKLLTY